MKIMICIPYYMEFQACKPGLLELMQNKDHEFVIEPRQGTQTYRTRNSFMTELKSSRKFQKPRGDYDYFMFIDSDIGFTAFDIIQLLSHGKDVVGGPYLTHDNDGTYEAGLFSKTKPGRTVHRFKSTETGLKKVDWLASGFVLIKASVFEKVEYPWFRHSMIESGDLQEESGEDVGFCLNFARFGVEIWMDFDLEIYHRPREYDDFDWEIELKGVTNG